MYKPGSNDRTNDQKNNPKKDPDKIVKSTMAQRKKVPAP